MEPNEELQSEIRALLAEGKKIDAIRVLREKTGASLLLAKQAVEAIESGGDSLGRLAGRGLSEEDEQQLVNVLKQDGKIAAIKRHREITGATLVDAKQAVEALAVKHLIEPAKEGCFGVILAFVAIVATAMSIA